MTEKEKQDLNKTSDRPSGPPTKRVKSEVPFGLTPLTKGNIPLNLLCYHFVY